VISATKVNNLIRCFEDLAPNFDQLDIKREIVPRDGGRQRNCNVILSIIIFIYISCAILPMQIFNYYWLIF